MNLKEAVQLPEGEDQNEWLAMHGGPCAAAVREPATQPYDRVSHTHTHAALPLPVPAPCSAVDFFNRINLVYGAGERARLR